jgi:23S rRNA pseudouridine2605 synthase
MASMERKNTRVHQEAVRLNKFLAMAGVGSRRKNDELILSGVVRINGKVVTELGTKVDVEKDHVSVNGMETILEDRKVYILLNKPKDTITTMSDEKGRATVMQYVRTKQRVFPIGRLDRNTTGILLFTNDGELANALIHPKFEVEKMYRATLARPVGDDDIKKLRKGVRLDDGLAKVKSVEIIDGSKRKKVLLTLQEGRNREVRRIFEAIDHDVRQLDRVMFAGLTPLGVPRGEWRFLSREEIRYLRQLTGLEKGINELLKK